MATYYIALDGNDDTGDGTEINPWLTLTKAHAESIDNDTIVVGEGTWDLEVGTFFTKARIYQAASYDTILTKSAAARFTIGEYDKDVIVKGFTWTGLMSGASTVMPTFLIDTGDGQLYFENNRFIDLIPHCAGGDRPGMFGNGFSYYRAANVSFSGCIFSGLASLDGSNSRFFMGAGNEATPLHASFLNCTFYYNALDPYKPTELIRRAWYAITADPDYFSITFKNNIFYAIPGQFYNILYSLSDTYVTLDCDYNCYYGSFGGKPPSGEHDISADPKFINAEDGNFRLQTISPCLGKGTPTI